MSKSFKKEVFSENSNRNKPRDYKRRKNKIRENYSRDEYSDYNIHGYKREKNPM